ncbi:MAG: transglutaminase domain-containing protein [Erythrobacter sp.]
MATPAPETQRYSIAAPDGTIVGNQLELTSKTAQRITLARTRDIGFSIDGHDPIRLVSSVDITRDPETGANVRLYVRSQTTKHTERYVVTFEGDTATIKKWSGDNREETVTRQPIERGIPIHDPEIIGLPAPQVFYMLDIGTGRLVKRTSRTVPADTGESGLREVVLTYGNGSAIHIWLISRSSEGAIENAIKPQVGSRFIFRPLARNEVVNQSRSGTIGHPMLDSPNAISSSAKQGHIRYRVRLLEALAQSVPRTPEQRIKVTPEGMQLDVCTGCGSGFATDRESLEEWRSPTRWLQSDYPAIAEVGADVGARDVSDADKLRQLSRFARRRLKNIDLNGHYSARSAWRRRAGDCTEDAVLLAALARAAGIPARIASGLAYTRERYHGARDAFIPHAWVIAYLDGEWRSFDMTTKEGFGAGHIALSVGDGAAHEIAAANLIAGMIEWEGLSLIRKRDAD